MTDLLYIIQKDSEYNMWKISSEAFILDFYMRSNPMHSLYKIFVLKLPILIKLLELKYGKKK